MPSPEDFEQRMRELEATVARLWQRSPFTNSGVHPNGQQGLDSDNFVHGVSGFSLNGGTGTPEFNDLLLRGGIIGNDALANPTSPQVIYASTTNFGVTTTVANKLTSTLTVPDGFTKLAAMVTARVYVINPNTTGGYDSLGGEYLYGQANIAGFNGYALPLPISGSNGSGTNISTFAAVLSGLTPGSPVLVQAAAQTAFASVAANANNVAELSGLATWYR